MIKRVYIHIYSIFPNVYLHIIRYILKEEEKTEKRRFSTLTLEQTWHFKSSFFWTHTEITTRKKGIKKNKIYTSKPYRGRTENN